MEGLHNRKIVLIVALVASLASLPVFSQDPTDEAAAKVNEKLGGNIQKLIVTKCSVCRQGYGMQQTDGRKLAGTSKTLKQLMKQIREGKSPMPGFKNQLKNEEIQTLAEYIKALSTD